MKNRSYLKKIVLESLLSLMIPLLTVFLLWGISEKIVKEQILKTSDNVLNLFTELIDDSLSDCINTIYSISYDSHCEAYSRNIERGKAYGYASYELCSALKVLDDTKYEDIFIYFPKSDQILSVKHGTFSSNNYYQTFYKDQEVAYESFQRMICATPVRPKLLSLKRSNSQPYMCIAMARNISRKTAFDYVVVEIIDPSYLEEIKNAAGNDVSSEIIIFDSDGNILVGSHGIFEYQLEQSSTAERFEDVINGKSYTMQAVNAKNIEGYYAIATPTLYFWQQLRTLRTVNAIGCTLCILLSCIIVFKGSKRTYQPVEDMVRVMESHSSSTYDGKHLSEFDYFHDVLEKSKEEKNLLRVKSKEHEKLRAEKRILSLIYKDTEELMYSSGKYEQEQFRFRFEYFTAVVINVVGESSMGAELVRFALNNIYSELFSEMGDVYVSQIDSKNYIILVNSLFDDKDKIDNLLGRGQQFISNNLFEITMARGDCHSSSYGVRQSFVQAKAAIKYQYLFGLGSYIPYDRIRGRSFSYQFSEESKLSNKLMGFVKSKSNELSAEGLISEILKLYLIDETSSIETVECFRYELISSFRKAMAYCGMGDQSEEIIDKLLKKPSFGEFLEDSAVLLFELWKKAQEDDRGICVQAKNFVHDYYHDQQLSVQLIGDKLSISSWYLSRMFKDKYGISLFDYIVQVRINVAKELLANTSSTVSDIAEKVGFSNSKVFINNFKKVEGITPGNYREIKKNPATERLV